jgi:hypothetical protein
MRMRSLWLMEALPLHQRRMSNHKAVRRIEPRRAYKRIVMHLSAIPVSVTLNGA